MTEPNPQPPTNIDAMSPPHELRKGGKQGAIGSEQEWTAVSTGAARHRRRARITSALFAVLLGVLAAPATRSAAEDPPFLTGPSDAHRVAVSSGVNNKSGGPGTPNWWDHTNLTVAVTAAPGADVDGVRAVRDSVATWTRMLAERLPIVSLTDITDTSRARTADIVLHYVPHSGGVVWSGQAVCGPQHCSNVMLRSQEPPGGPYPDLDYLRIYRDSLHELGHALGLGHATPIDTSTDLMAYGWEQVKTDPVTGNYVFVYRTPILSDCDIAGVAATFAWAINGEAPHPAIVSFVTC